MVERAEFKLPMTGKMFKLRHLPNQPDDKKYALAVGAFRQPGQKIGYLMELTGHRRGKLVAWLQDGGTVYECSEPLAFLPAGAPSIMLTKWSDSPGGRVDACAGASGTLQLVSQYRGDRMLNFFEPSRDLGKLPSQALGMGEFLAACFLEFVEFPRLAGSPLSMATPGQMSNVLEPFLRLPMPDACDTLVFRVDSDPSAASSFERYAAWLLKCAHSERLRAIATKTPVRVSRLSNTGLFWLQWDAARLDADETAVMLGVESALNRCKLICDDATQSDGLGALSSFGEAYCSDHDLALLRRVADKSPELMERGAEDNPWRRLGKAEARPNGEWDVRTRFANAVESLALPFRLAYRFDCNVRDGALAVDFTTPPVDLLPSWRWDNASASWADITASRTAAASCYALRLSALMAAVGFSSGVGVTRVVVTACAKAGCGEPLLSMMFDRIPFLAQTLAAIKSGRLSDPALEGDPRSLLTLLSPAACSFELDAQGGLSPVPPLEIALPSRIKGIGEDQRPLPAELASRLHAERVCDLAIWEEDAADAERVRSIADTADASTIAAVAELEMLAAGRSFEPRDGRLPLYSDSFAERLLVGLVAPDDARFYRVPDADYLALFHLSRLYRGLGDGERAKTTALKLREIAPASAMAAEQLASVHADAHDFSEAARVLREALAYTSAPERADYLYYRLAWMLWQDGKKEAALATYALLMDSDGQFAEQAKTEGKQLMDEMGRTDAPTSEERDEALGAERIPAAPTKEVRSLLADAATGLTDATLPELAWHAAAALWWIRADARPPVIDSLREGLGR